MAQRYPSSGPSASSSSALSMAQTQASRAANEYRLEATRKRAASEAILGESLRSAARTKRHGGGGMTASAGVPRPAHRALPPSIERQIPESALFTDLLRAERAMDWTLARKRVEILDASSKPAQVKRTLRIFLSNTSANQPRAKPVAEEGAETTPAPDAPPATPAAPVPGSSDPPSWTVRIEGRLLEPAFRSRSTAALAAEGVTRRVGAQKFSNLVQSLVVEVMRDGHLHPSGSNIVEWHRPTPTVAPSAAQPSVGTAQGEPPTIASSEPALDGFEIRRLGDQPVKIRIALHLAHNPPRYAVSEDLANLLDVREETRTGVLSAVWAYIKTHNLLDDTSHQAIRCDASLRHVFGADVIQFHNLPEAIARKLHPPQPIVIEYMVRTDKDFHKHPTAYDVEIDMDDTSTRQKYDSVLRSFDTPSDKTQEIKQLDDQIAQATATIRSRSLARDFLRSFATNPQGHIRTWLSSQSRDLDAIIGTRAQNHGIGQEEMRRAETFTGDWVEEAVVVSESIRLAERMQELQG